MREDIAACRTRITAMLHGTPVYNKIRLRNMPRLCSDNMERMVPFVNFDEGFSGASNCDAEVKYFAGDANTTPGEWSPEEFKCIEFYDWDISP